MGKKTRKDFDTDLEYETYRKKINAAEVKRRGKIRPQINAAEEKRNRELKQEVMNEYSIGITWSWELNPGLTISC